MATLEAELAELRDRLDQGKRRAVPMPDQRAAMIA